MKINTNDENDEYYFKRNFEKCLLSYMHETFFSFKMSKINEIINNEVFYRELCKIEKADKKDNSEEKKDMFNSVSILKFLFKYIKEDIRENFFFNNTFSFKNDFHNHVFMDKLIEISDHLAHEIYTYSNINFEAENRICMLLYLVKQIITKYPLFFKKTHLEHYIKAFKKYKKYFYFLF